MRKGIFTCLLLWLAVALLPAQEIEIPQVQNTLITKHTATWCPPCGQAAWVLFNDLRENEREGAVFLQAHRSTISKYYSPTAVDLLRNMDRNLSQPEFFTNTNYAGNGINATETNILEFLAAARQQSPVAQTGLIFGYDQQTNTLNVRTRTRFFQSAEGDFSLGVYLVNKVLVGPQESRSSQEEHHEVLVGELSDASFGGALATGTIEGGAEFDYNLSKAFPEGLDIENVQITVVLWKKEPNDRYSLVNSNVALQASDLTTTSSNEQGRLDAVFQVLPTVVTNEAYVRLETSQTYEQAELALFDLSGRRLQTVYRGRIPAGFQTFRLDRPAALASGLYVLRLQAGSASLSRKVILR